MTSALELLHFLQPITTAFFPANQALSVSQAQPTLLADFNNIAGQSDISNSSITFFIIVSLLILNVIGISTIIWYKLKVYHRNKELLKTISELKDGLTTRDKFISIISHDLRSPFNVFLGMTTILAEESENMTNAEIQQAALNIKDTAIKVHQLLEDLLDWSRVQQGLLSVNPVELRLHPVIMDCIQPYQVLAKKKQIDLKMDIPEEIELFADRMMIQTALRNLISNALKFTPKNGRVTLAAKSTTNNHVDIIIQDSGIGMNRHLLEKLFKLDVTKSRTGTEHEPGTGLGLIICKEFIEKNNGNIRVESEEGKGSVFSVTLPHYNLQSHPHANPEYRV